MVKVLWTDHVSWHYIFILFIYLVRSNLYTQDRPIKRTKTTNKILDSVEDKNRIAAFLVINININLKKKEKNIFHIKYFLYKKKDYYFN